MKTTNCLDFDSEYDRDNTKYPCLFLFNPLTPTLSVYHTHNTDIKLQGIYIILVLIIYRHLKTLNCFQFCEVPFNYYDLTRHFIKH